MKTNKRILWVVIMVMGLVLLGVMIAQARGAEAAREYSVGNEVYPGPGEEESYPGPVDVKLCFRAWDGEPCWPSE